MKKTISALLTAAMLVMSAGAIPVMSEDGAEPTFEVSADNITYTPVRTAENEYYVELLNAKTENITDTVDIAVSGVDGAVTAKLDGTAAAVTDNKVTIGDHKLHEVEITAAGESYKLHIYPTIYVGLCTNEGAGVDYNHGGTVTAANDNKSTNALRKGSAGTTDDDIYQKIGYDYRYQFFEVSSVTYQPEINTAGKYKLYAWQTYYMPKTAYHKTATIDVNRGENLSTNNSVSWYNENGAQWVEVGEYYFDPSENNSIVVKVNDDMQSVDTGSDNDIKRISSIKLVLTEDSVTDARVSVTGASGNAYSLKLDGTDSYSIELLENDAEPSVQLTDKNAQLSINGVAVTAENGVYTQKLKMERGKLSVKITNGGKSKTYTVNVYPTYYIAPNYEIYGAVKGGGYSSNIDVIVPPAEYTTLGLSNTNSSRYGSDLFTYALTNIPKGTYSVQTWTTYHKSKTEEKCYQSATAEIYHNGQTDQQTVAWYTNPQSWQTVGEYEFAGDGTESVRLSKGQVPETDADQFRVSAIKLVQLQTEKEDVTAILNDAGETQTALTAGNYVGKADFADAATDGVVILAKYNRAKELKDVTIKPLENGSAQTEKMTVTADEVTDGYFLKLFVFDGFNTMKSIGSTQPLK